MTLAKVLMAREQCRDKARRKTLEMQLKKAYTEFGQLAYRQLTGDGKDDSGQAELEKGIREIARLESLLRNGGDE